MASLEETQSQLDGLLGGGLSYDIDMVMKESATNLLKQQGNSNPSDSDVQAVVDVWTKNPDGTEKSDVRRFYDIKMKEVSSKFVAVTKSLGNIPTQFAGITAAAASATASPAAAPMFVAIKTEVNNDCNLLAEALKICCELNIGAPDALIELISVFNACKSIVGA